MQLIKDHIALVQKIFPTKVCQKILYVKIEKLIFRGLKS